MVTEPAMPLSAWLEANRPRAGAAADARTEFAVACVWGVYTLTTALAFLASCDLLHGGVQPDAIFVTRGGDWKLGGFELCCDSSSEEFPGRWFTDNDARGTCPVLFKSPERAAREWGPLGSAPHTAIDAYSLGVMLLDVYGVDCGGGPDSVGSHAAASRTPADVRVGAAAITAAGSPVPNSLRPLLARLLSTSARSRPTFGEVLGAEYFRHPLVGALLFLDELALKEPSVRPLQRHRCVTCVGNAPTRAATTPACVIYPPRRRRRRASSSLSQRSCRASPRRWPSTACCQR